MIYKCKQNTDGGLKSFLVLNNNSVIATASQIQSSLQQVGLTVEILDSGNKYVMYGDRNENATHNNLNGKNLFSLSLEELSELTKVHIYDKMGSEIGSVKSCTKEKVGLAENYHLLSIGNINYFMYEIDKTFKGKFYFVYLNDKPIAAMHLMKAAVNYLHNYDLYLIDDNYFDVALLFLTYIDNRKYMMNWFLGETQIDIDVGIAVQAKSIKEKYDKDFLEKATYKE